MRTLLLACIALVLPLGAAAANRPAKAASAKAAPAKAASARITDEQAKEIALKVAGDDIGKNDLSSWGDPKLTGLAPANIKADGVVFNPATNTIAVGVSSPKVKGHARIVLDAGTGDVVSKRVGASWGWAGAPAWWKLGANSPPAAEPRKK